ncbi:MAG: alpha/beta hydrolase [Planctomycetes bacterium]|nr:alpha/beta hydrolase [Planctomycetota bacterium]
MTRSISRGRNSCVATTVVAVLPAILLLIGPVGEKGLAQQRTGRKKQLNPTAASARLAAAPAPTFADVSYGPHARNVLDFWQARSDKPTPVIVFIHGGGFTAGDKSKVRGDKIVPQCLDAGVSFAAINYRYRTDTPIQDVLRDCARAIQFIRWKAAEWNVDRMRMASYGGSAGAGTSLWLAFHADLADPNSSDPVLRESSRLVCAGANACQFSYDLLEWEKLFGEAVQRFQGGENLPGFYGLKTDEMLRGPVGQRIRADCDMRGLISTGDAPVFLNTGQEGGEITDRGHLLHHPKHALAIYDRCREVGVPVVANIPAVGIRPRDNEPQNLTAFLFKHLGVAAITGKDANQ